MMTLAELTGDQLGIVEEVTGQDATSLRLLEMGLTPGCEVRYVGKAPLGDPLEFSLRGYNLSLRRVEAARVRIRIS